MISLPQCLPNYPSGGEVNPSTKFFNVCCGSKVVIEHSEIDRIDGQKEEFRFKEKTQRKKKDSTHIVL